MDNAVALVQAYLRINGYFTITEVPLIERIRGGFRAATDLDVLAFRPAPQAFPGPSDLPEESKSRAKAARNEGGRSPRINSDGAASPDPILGCDLSRSDMLIAEVKEGRATLNKGARDSKVLAAALIRFGCCSASHAVTVAESLGQHGEALVHAGHRVRLVAFGSQIEEGHTGYLQVPLGHITDYLSSRLRQRWRELHHTQFKDPALGFLMMLEKARRGHDKPPR